MRFEVLEPPRTSSNPLKTHDIRESEVCRALSEKVGVVQAHRTSANPLKMHEKRESEVCRALSSKLLALSLTCFALYAIMLFEGVR